MEIIFLEPLPKLRIILLILKQMVINEGIFTKPFLIKGVMVRS